MQKTIQVALLILFSFIVAPSAFGQKNGNTEAQPDAAQWKEPAPGKVREKPKRENENSSKNQGKKPERETRTGPASVRKEKE